MCKIFDERFLLQQLKGIETRGETISKFRTGYFVDYKGYDCCFNTYYFSFAKTRGNGVLYSLGCGIMLPNSPKYVMSERIFNLYSAKTKVEFEEYICSEKAQEEIALLLDEAIEEITEEHRKRFIDIID